jgi:hypothetical protein
MRAVQSLRQQQCEPSLVGAVERQALLRSSVLLSRRGGGELIG